jgi:hypothetical protein
VARRSVRRSKPTKPKAPILTAEQKRRRTERLKKCIRDHQAFDPRWGGWSNIGRLVAGGETRNTTTVEIVAAAFRVAVLQPS